MKGGLPWQGVKAKDRNTKYEIIKEMKTRMPIHELVKMKIDKKAKPTLQEQGTMSIGIAIPGVIEDNIPEEFVTYMDYCRNLKFDEKPDYSYLRRLFKDLFNRHGYEYDYVFDWINLSKHKAKTARSLNMRRTSNQPHQNIGSPKA